MRILLTMLMIPALCVPSPAVADDPVSGITKTHESYVEKLSNGILFKMIAIKEGTFQLGSPDSEKGRQSNEGPQRQVRLNRFWLGEHEVTWDEFREYYRNQPLGEKIVRSNRDRAADAVSKPSGSYVDETYGFGEKGYPAINISHHAAMKYCEWLSEKTGKSYRLPTEAEWEYACRAGTSTAYSFGDKTDDHFLWYRDNSATEAYPRGQAHPVGRKKPNSWGLYDMHGNVSEWCLDHFEPKRYETLPWDKPALNPVKLPSDKRYSYVTRGGDFSSLAINCRSAIRVGSSPKWNEQDPEVPQSIWWMFSGGKSWVGFRVARAFEDSPELDGIRSKVTRQSK